MLYGLIKINLNDDMSVVVLRVIEKDLDSIRRMNVSLPFQACNSSENSFN